MRALLRNGVLALDENIIIYYDITYAMVFWPSMSALLRDGVLMRALLRCYVCMCCNADSRGIILEWVSVLWYLVVARAHPRLIQNGGTLKIFRRHLVYSLVEISPTAVFSSVQLLKRGIRGQFEYVLYI